MTEFNQKIEKWDTWEITCPGHTDSNPFVDYQIHGTFTAITNAKQWMGFTMETEIMWFGSCLLLRGIITF